ncbi:hypothetical protein [Pseudonocardia broussonetiae]|uniref:Uncharacterized protein n=1 Tax=Pseudonocardia broussonetiae TaxID=2736640 RepID=A0A6M6JW41_9PSEU|nr:hypothetical protein [Pseudonocardia broussonetiae]QJY51202.1 hypothetical protein HOP40_35040 [Pseudonocardia broussonetiae]QJY51216.1 hypothetical protein HOP40_35115 [Pseudonocardia broussonetiae]
MNTRRRAGDTKGALSRGLLAARSAPPAAPAPEVPDEVVAEVPVAVTTPEPVRTAKQRTSKFTANLDPQLALAFDELAMAARRRLERRVDKLDVLKALIMLAADDASLRDQVINEIENSGGGRR